MREGVAERSSPPSVVLSSIDQAPTYGPVGRLKLQTASTGAGIALAILAVLSSVSLMWLSTELNEGTQLVARNSESVAVADDLELALFRHSRVANLALATGDPAHERHREAIEGELETLLARAGRLTGADHEEERRLGAVRAAVQRYHLRRQQLEAAAPSLPRLVAGVGPSLDAAVAAVRSLREHNEAQMTRASAAADRLDRLANAIGVSIAAVAILAIGVLLVAVRRYVVQPLTAIREAITRWRGHGEEPGAAPARGLRETVEIARAFNDMSAELARQRQAQLTFLAGVAHDLRNPLGALSMASQTLRDEADELGPGAESVLDLLDRQVKRLNRMIGDLLDAARIEAGHLELEPERVDLREPVREIAQLYASTSPCHALRLRLPDEPVSARVDPLRVEQVVSNLVSNAIKYSPDGGEVVVALDARDDEAWITVSDEGRGIPSAEHETIFEPFRRRRETKDLAPGVGLGLSVVRRIVRAHGGDVEVESEPGRGTSFRVRLPRRSRRASADAPVGELSPSPSRG